MKSWKIEHFGKWKNWKRWKNETWKIEKMEQWKTICYHMVENGTIRYLGRGGARRCWDAIFFRIFDLWKKRSVFYIKKSNKFAKLIKYKGILTFWRLEKNPHEISVILVQTSLGTDNSESSYDTFLVSYYIICYII